jgi:murein DD-endopeptidase MepM/ murein hydrolase activator NlpD
VTMRGRRWAALLALVAAGCGLRAPPRGALPALMVPVAGVSPAQVPDGFRAPRDGGGIHGAVDILAPRGTPVVAADDGRVLRRHRNRKGGLTLYATDVTEQFVYYYAHLSAYREGIDKGTRLVRGQVIGFVGTTGNADRREPHLHFQMLVRPGGGRWWNGDAIDPRPLFTSAGEVRAQDRSAKKIVP